jgi:hypothetical protein
LPSWNDGKAKKAITAFVLTMRGGSELIRIPAAGGAPLPLGRIICDDSSASFGLLGGLSLIDDRTLLARVLHVGLAGCSSRRGGA